MPCRPGWPSTLRGQYDDFRAHTHWAAVAPGCRATFMTGAASAAALRALRTPLRLMATGSSGLPGQRRHDGRCRVGMDRIAVRNPMFTMVTRSTLPRFLRIQCTISH